MAPTHAHPEGGAAEAPKAAPAAACWRLAPPPADFDYVAPGDMVDPDLQCSVCLCWPVDPVVLGCPGGHMFCRRCVKGPLCPLDRQPFARCSAPQRPILGLLGRLTVRCPEAAAGCTWTGPRGNLADHSGACPRAERECVRCGLRLRPSDPAFQGHVHETPPTLLLADAGGPTAAALPESRDALAASHRLEAISRVIDIYEQSERLNVCFVVDCTGSMGSHIWAVKTQIQWIVHELRARLPSMQLHLAFVGYRDHCDDERILVLPFTNSVDTFQSFVSPIRARGGGGDGPEDVHGAVEKACELDWAIGGAATRVLIHIADYPAHGKRYNNCLGDYYPQGDPRGLDLEALLLQLKNRSVQYIFGHITGHTQKMVEVLNEALGNYIDSKNMQNVELLAEVVTSSLHTSVASTVSTLSSSPRLRAPEVVLSDEAPDWQAITPDAVQLRECRRIEEISSLYPGADPSLTRQFEERRALVSLAALPFSQGETRVARHALCEGTAAVAKHFKRLAEDDDADGGIGSPATDAHLALSEVSAVAGFLASLFSMSRPVGERVSFLASAAAEGGRLVPFNWEEALPAARFQRFSTNIGWWEAGAPRTLMEFTRFTHEATRGHMMVVDLQGVSSQDGWLLTDPCILCEDVERFGSGNMGPHAMGRCLAALRVRLDEAPPAVPAYSPAAPAAPLDASPWRPPGVARLTPQDINLHVDPLIEALKSSRQRAGRRVDPEEGQIRALLRVARDILLRQPTLLELQAPINVVGDVHGQFHDLLRIFEAGGFPPDANYLMLGDYVDRGQHSIETMCLLLAYKVKYPDNMFLLRGNHECACINRIYGFYDECKRRYDIRLWKQFCDVFNCLPPAALIDDRILCMHGGPSPELHDFECIRNLPRPCDVPDTGLLCDMLWADPDTDVIGWQDNDRGVSYRFGQDVLERLLPDLAVDLIARAHQVVEDGYEFFGDRRLVTIFSAPDYCGEFDNAGAMMVVGGDLGCSFKLLRSARRQQPSGVAGTASPQGSGVLQAFV